MMNAAARPVWPRKSAAVCKNLDSDLANRQGGNMATLRVSPSSEPISGANAEREEMKLEVVVIPVADVDRSKQFYTKLGWRLDADFRFDNGFRVVQFTPPGSGCSVQFGTKITPAAPGSAQGLYLIVSDVGAARTDLVARGIEVTAAVASAEPLPSMPPTTRSPHFVIPTAMDGCFRKSQRVCLAEDLVI
jgi:catechol 2,3-dioxygenase-like lactoylglutathione lyase family enzyme